MVYTPMPSRTMAATARVVESRHRTVRLRDAAAGRLCWVQVVTRFAPAPTGFLHLGHVVNALHVWGAARVHRGTVLLRIEDHDRQRSRTEYESAIIEDLAWLGFKHDGDVVRQSEREPLYHRAIQKLIDRGLVYGCACSRSDFDGERYPNTCRDKGIPLDNSVGWRRRSTLRHCGDEFLFRLTASRFATSARRTAAAAQNEAFQLPQGPVHK